MSVLVARPEPASPLRPELAYAAADAAARARERALAERIASGRLAMQSAGSP
jgi:hypothetical protein